MNALSHTRFPLLSAKGWALPEALGEIVADLAGLGLGLALVVTERAATAGARGAAVARSQPS